ncbi:MAG TPA: ubiquinol-cytochrome c reductase iron-sulfur subunit [Anaerolineales bacterium]|nr:ubiquinol-cytochrome c reductase iron-sulfur subunit [Anaerolineales bacterium]
MIRKVENLGNADRPLTRRDFLSLAAWAGILVSGVTALGQILRFLQPAVTYGPAAVFSVGSPDDFPLGSRRLFQRERVLIVRDERGFRALSAVCTHLSCTVTLMEWGFNCPCHGSKFDSEGVNFAGPAPRPLPCFQLMLSPEGQLTVDTRRTVPRNQFFNLAATNSDA